MGIYAQATAVLLLFAFIGFIIMAGKGWRWHHVTALVLIFLSSMMFAFLAAAVLKNKSVWMTKYQQLAEELEKEQQLTQEKQFGPLSAAAEDAESLRGLRNELQRVIVDRGRVWRDVELTGAQGNQIAFKFPDRNITGLDAPPPLHRLQPNAVVYGFKEKDSPDGWKVPALFMGEFVVQPNTTPDTVIVTPSLPMDPVQRAEVKPDGVTWALYEVMPVDAHYKFDGLTDEQIRELLMPGGWHGRPSMAAGPQYEEVVRQYLRDGEEATEADPPERIWTVVRLTQPWKVDVDAPAAVQGQVPTRPFDVTGLALIDRLRQGAPSEFEIGEEIELDHEAAQRLIDQGIATRVRDVYRRPLNDYAYEFKEITRNIRVLDDRAKLVTKANDTVQQAIDKAKKEIAFREDEKTKLTEDLGHVNQEKDAMTQYADALKKHQGDLVANLRAVYTENLELVDRIRRIEQAIINAIQQQLAEAASAPAR
jgi:hypothetical protein